MATRRQLLAGVTATLAIASVVAIGAYFLPQKNASSRIDPEDARQVALGHAVYERTCAVCHGVNLEGQPDWRIRKPDGRLPAPPHNAEGHTWHHPDEQLLGIVKNGIGPYAPPGYQSDMPAFGATLSNDDIRAVLAYIESSWPPAIRARQRAMTEATTKR